MDGEGLAKHGGIAASRRLSAAVVSSLLAHGALATLLAAPHVGGRASIEQALAVFAVSDAAPEPQLARVPALVLPRPARPPAVAPPRAVTTEAPRPAREVAEPTAEIPRAPEAVARPDSSPPVPAAAAPVSPADATPRASIPSLDARAARPAEPEPPEARHAALPLGRPSGLLAVPRGAHQPAPVYPESARRAGVEGTTVLKVRIVETGAVGEVHVARSAGAAVLDEAAVDAVRRWRFVPARRGTESVAVWVSLPVRFELE